MRWVSRAATCSAVLFLAGALQAAQLPPGVPPSSPPTPGSAGPGFDAQGSAPTNQGYEELARGPIHEAFAEPVGLNPVVSAPVPKQPPEPIEEIAADSRPEGEAEWFPGYWSWDDERKDFLWV